VSRSGHGLLWGTRDADVARLRAAARNNTGQFAAGERCRAATVLCQSSIKASNLGVVSQWGNAKQYPLKNDGNRGGNLASHCKYNSQFNALRQHQSPVPTQRRPAQPLYYSRPTRSINQAGCF
jgi:hypothetical protein